MYVLFLGNFNYPSHAVGQPTIYKDDYVGPTPLTEDYWASTNTVKFRRAVEYGRNLRFEYGFKPQFSPSTPIDEHGNPLKEEKET